MNPRPSDYKAQPRGFYRLLRLTVSPSETAVYGPLESHGTTPDFYRFLRRVPQVFTIVAVPLYNLRMIENSKPSLRAAKAGAAL